MQNGIIIQLFLSRCHDVQQLVGFLTNISCFFSCLSGAWKELIEA